VAGISAAGALDAAHVLSAGAVGFARGLNDTPKIAALLVAAPALGATVGTAMVGLAMVVGGLLNARKVAETMSHKITAMNAGQGFTGNVVSALLVTVASRYGVPVSTTHVTCGSLFGIGLATGDARWKTIGGIALAWVATLPVAFALAALASLLLA
jgi:PiT family inorganic phosphate transporter